MVHLIPLLLSVTVWTPLLGALLLFVLWKMISTESFLKHGASLVSFAIFTLTVFIFSGLEPNGFQQLQEIRPWIPSLGLQYALSVNGVSALYAVSVTFLSFLVIIWSNLKNPIGVLYILIAESAMLGALFAQDLALFYLFWELLMIFHGGERRLYAAYRFFLFTFTGSLFILAGLLYLSVVSFRQLGYRSFLITDLMQLHLPQTAQILLATGFLVAFLVKVPAFPFHTWLRDAQCESPIEGSLLFTAILFQMGIYGLLLFVFPLFPAAWATVAPVLAVLAVISIIYGALLAYRENNLRAVVAYSSISHLGFCILGIAAFTNHTLTGAVFHSVAHAVSGAAILMLVGGLERSGGITLRNDGGGLATLVPAFAVLYFVVLVGYLALPLTNGFVGEAIIVVGSFTVFPLLTLCSLIGMVLGALYMLRIYGEIFFGAALKKTASLVNSENSESLICLNFSEWCAIAPLVVLTFAMGVFPTPILARIETVVEQVTQRVLSEQIKSGKLRYLTKEYNNNGGVPRRASVSKSFSTVSFFPFKAEK
jgi:NADH-quinone oxidoreductase subunit M